jgi:hypothetical protein
MPQFWIAIFFMLLAVAQLYESTKAIELPLPIYLVLGTMLAIASNAQQKFLLNPDHSDQHLTAPVLATTGQPILNSLQTEPLATTEQQDLDQLNM